MKTICIFVQKEIKIPKSLVEISAACFNCNILYGKIEKSSNMQWSTVASIIGKIGRN